MRSFATKLLAATAALAVFSVASAEARDNTRAHQLSAVSRTVVAQPQSPTVYVGGRYVGADPDPNVRLDLRREAGAADGGGA
ncbi:MAG TPA: hypothetical protein VFQ27_03520 [Xanthobacteraceae bacterium]|nr:hypothetical protein [Xanthobacteraceae bacterium]